jgi:hypothetical protein
MYVIMCCILCISYICYYVLYIVYIIYMLHIFYCLLYVLCYLLYPISYTLYLISYLHLTYYPISHLTTGQVQEQGAAGSGQEDQPLSVGDGPVLHEDGRGRGEEKAEAGYEKCLFYPPVYAKNAYFTPLCILKMYIQPLLKCLFNPYTENM